MSIQNIRFLLKEIQVYYDGDFFAGTKDKKQPKKNLKDNLLEASLEYPRSGVPIVTTAKMLDLQSKVVHKANLKDFWDSGLFKEDIDGETRFKLSVSDKDEISQFSRWFRRIFSIMFSTATGSGVKAISNLFQGAVASDLQSKFKDGIKGEQKDSSIKLLCSSDPIHIELSDKGIAAFTLTGKKKASVLNEKGEMVIELKAVKDFVKKMRPKKKRGSVVRTREEVLMFEKGDKLGEATIVLFS